MSSWIDPAMMTGDEPSMEVMEKEKEIAVAKLMGGADPEPTGPLAAVSEPTTDQKIDMMTDAQQQDVAVIETELEEMREGKEKEKLRMERQSVAMRTDWSVSDLPKAPLTWKDIEKMPGAKEKMKEHSKKLLGKFLEKAMHYYEAHSNVCPNKQCLFPATTLSGESSAWDYDKCEKYLNHLEEIRTTRSYSTGGAWLEDFISGTDQKITFNPGNDHPVLKIGQEPKSFKLLFDRHYDPTNLNLYDEEHSIDIALRDKELSSIFKRVEDWRKCSLLKCLDLKCKSGGECKGDHPEMKNGRTEKMHPHLFLPTNIEIVQFRNTGQFDVSVDISTKALDTSTRDITDVDWSSSVHSNAFAQIPDATEANEKVQVVSYANILSGNTPALTTPKLMPTIFAQQYDKCILQRLIKWGAIWDARKVLDQYLIPVDVISDPTIVAISYQSIGERNMVSPNPVHMFLAEQLHRLSLYDENGTVVFAKSGQSPARLWKVGSDEPEPENIKRVREAIWLSPGGNAENNLIYVYKEAFSRLFTTFIQNEVARNKRVMEFPHRADGITLNASLIKSAASKKFFEDLQQEGINRVEDGMGRSKFDKYFETCHLSVEVNVTGYICRIAE